MYKFNIYNFIQVIYTVYIKIIYNAPSDMLFLQVCNQCDREDVLLLCDGCDRG